MTTLLEHSRAAIDTQIGLGNTSADLQSGQTVLNGVAVSSLDPVGLFGGVVAGTLVANGTVGIVAYAWHTGIIVGASITFGGNSYTIADIANVANTDLGFAKLNAQVTDVEPMPVLPVPSGGKYGGLMVGLPAVWIIKRSDRIQLREVADIGEDSPGGLVFVGIPTDPAWEIGTTPVGGDSSSSLVTVVNGKLVFMGAARYANAAPAILRYHEESEAIWLSDFGVTDTYTQADLSEFDGYLTAPTPTPTPSPTPPPEPLVLENDMAKTTIFTGGGLDTLDEAGNWSNGLPSREGGDTAIINNPGQALASGTISAAFLILRETIVDFEATVLDVGQVTFDGVADTTFYRNSPPAMTFPLS